MKLHLYLFGIAVFLFTMQVNAQVYKCAHVDDVTRQHKVVYSDSPCTKTEKQTLIDIQAKSQVSAQTMLTTQLASVSTVDAAVTRAVLNQEFKLAKSLATTKEHWRLIAIAEGESAPQPLPQPLIVANTQAVVSPAYECALAKDDFESTSSTSWRDKDLVAAKKNVMYAACGVVNPVVNRPILVGHTYGGFGGYGGLYNGRRYHPHHAVPHQIRAHGSVGSQAYPANHRYHGRNESRNNIGGVRLTYKSKHFGINVNGANVR